MADTTEFSSLLEVCAEKNTVTRADVAALKASIVALPAISEDDAARLITLNQGKKQDAAQWDAFYIETLTEYMICDLAPIGYVSHENAEWLVAHIAMNDAISRKNNIELLLSVLEKGICVPAALSAFALRQVAEAIKTGKGVLREQGAKGEKGFVSASDTAMLKRILLAFGNFGSVAITREEAEVLFAINDATVGAENAAEWQDLFNAAITNLVLATSGYAVPERSVALEQDAHVQLTEEIANALVGQLSGLLGHYPAEPEEERVILRNANWLQEEDNRIVSHSEAVWLAERLARHQALHANERAIIAYLSAHAPSLHPAFQELVEKQAA